MVTTLIALMVLAANPEKPEDAKAVRDYIKQHGLQPLSQDELRRNQAGVFYGSYVKVVQILKSGEKGSALVNIGPSKREFDVIFQDIDTRDAADGKVVTYSAPVWVSGTESFTTVSGAKRTVFVVQPLDVKRLR